MGKLNMKLGSVSPGRDEQLVPHTCRFSSLPLQDPQSSRSPASAAAIMLRQGLLPTARGISHVKWVSRAQLQAYVEGNCIVQIVFLH